MILKVEWQGNPVLNGSKLNCLTVVKYFYVKRTKAKFQISYTGFHRPTKVIIEYCFPEPKRKAKDPPLRFIKILRKRTRSEAQSVH